MPKLGPEVKEPFSPIDARLTDELFRRNTAKVTLWAFWEVLAIADVASPIAPPTR